MRIAIEENLFSYRERVYPIVRALADSGGTAYLVGGCVRDMVLGIALKDLDIEVHGVELQILAQVLARFGHVEEIGKKFGVLLVLGLAVDWSLPRTDSSGRKPAVHLQPQLDIKKALHRRDVTMNAMAINLTDVVLHNKSEIDITAIIDPFNGIKDIQERKLRAVDDDFFIQDPLRLLRVMQFIGRFAMQPVPELDALGARMALYDEYDDRPLAQERIHAEVAKLLLLSEQPSLGFAWLLKIGRAEELFPFFNKQEYVVAALQLVDIVVRRTKELDDTQRLMLLFAALCWPQWHDTAGSGSLRQTLATSTGSHDLIIGVEMILVALKKLLSVDDGDTGKVLCKKVASCLKGHATLALVARFAWCVDEIHVASYENTIIYKLAQAAGVLDGPEVALVQGRDLLDHVAPGPELGRLVALAYQIQLEEGERDKQVLVSRALQQRR